MGFFDSIFGIDVFGDGKPGMLDDAVILGMLEEDELDLSILAKIGNAIAWIFIPLGWGNWQAAVASITGLVAKDLVSGKQSSFNGPIILAVGNAARDTFRMLKEKGVSISAKDLAMGVRLEHPQHLIDQIQYHNPAGRGQFLPAAEYSFSTQVEVEGRKMGVYSFCMCPGGFVVPAASDMDQVVVNGMSPSSRGSKWANSGMVVEFPVTLLYPDSSAITVPLAMANLQYELENRTFLA